MTTKTKQQFMADKFFYGVDDLVEVNALDFIDLLVKEEYQERALRLLHSKLESLEVALECAKSRHRIDLRA